MGKLERKTDRTPKVATSNTVLQSALKYGEIGLRVIPLDERSKKPRSGFQEWPVKATSDKATIRKWFNGQPLSNLGMVTGQGLVAIDLDPAHGGFNSFKELVKGKELEWPFTAVAETGSGGRHYLFRLPPDVRVRNRTNLLPGLDVRGDGGYIVVEPSLHPETGRRYRWIYGPEQAVAVSPAWLVEFMLAARPGGGEEDNKFERRSALSNDRTADESILLMQVLSRFSVTAKGQRNGRLAQVIASLVGRGFEIGIVERVALGWWEHFYRLGIIGTDTSGAVGEIRSVVIYTLKNRNFRQSQGRVIDHRAELREIEMTEEKKREIGRMLEGNTISNTCNSSNSRSVDLHQAFVEALVIHFTHERACKPYGPLKATWTQFTEIMKDRHGLSLLNPQVERLMRKFISRPGKQASLRELAVQTVKGKTGVPSEYRLTGLCELLGASPQNPFILDVQSVHPR